MDKWEQQLKNDVNCPLSNNVDERIDKTLQHLPHRNQRPRIFYGLSAAIIAISITLGGVSFMSPTFAETMKSIPVIGSAFEFVGDIGIKKGKQEGLTTELGEQVEVDGQIITFTETLYDGGEIHIGYVVESMVADNRPHFLSNLEFLINGHSPGNYGMGGIEKEIENGLYAGTFSISVRNGVPDSFVLGIRPRQGRSWFVELPVELQGDHKSFLVNQTKVQEDLTILYDKVTFYTTSTELDLRLIIDEDVYLDDKYAMLDYQVLDEDGRVLEPFSGGGGGGAAENGKFIHSFKHYYEPLEPIPSSITIKPILREIDESLPKIIKKKWEGEEVTLSQGNIGHVTILDLVVSNDTVTLTYQVEGEHLYEQANALWIQDEEGNRFDSDETARRLDDTINRYQLSFYGTFNQQELFITTVMKDAPRFLEELEITIDLKK
ncbi:DUF4179 domain-containing protein [Halalkalibacter kiskunsagensis]|uniref:DUF4179 domain-containing protein n=1 Tax=Halalkalibacter kiskunsagensis TaxID=1548599 RepID=A0ABV6KDU2_9BACI